MFVKVSFISVLIVYCTICTFLEAIEQDAHYVVKRSAESSNSLFASDDEGFSDQGEDEIRKKSIDFSAFNKRPRLDGFKPSKIDPSWLAGFGKRGMKFKFQKVDPTWQYGAFGRRK